MHVWGSLSVCCVRNAVTVYVVDVGVGVQGGPQKLAQFFIKY